MNKKEDIEKLAIKDRVGVIVRNRDGSVAQNVEGEGKCQEPKAKK